MLHLERCLMPTAYLITNIQTLETKSVKFQI